jgi:uncharacterized protein YndB with AHSA1/START domain
MGLLVESEPVDDRRFRDVFVDHGHRVEIEAEITRYEPPRRLEVRLVADAFSARSTHVVEEAGRGSRLTTTVETEYTKRLARIAGPLVTRRAQAQLETDQRALKALLESG